MVITVNFDSYGEMEEFARWILGDERQEPAAAEDTMPATVPVTVPTAPAMVPASTKEYTLDELARVGMTLMDCGRQDALQKLLADFGVAALPALPREQYGAFEIGRAHV